MRDFEDVEIIGMLRSYVNATLKGMGAIKGSSVSIASIARNQADTANVVTFSWEDNTGVAHTSTMTVPDGLSAYQVAVKNGFSGTEQEWLDSLHGDGSGGGSYDDTEIKAEINDIWKVQGEVGAKNLLKYPYQNLSGVSQGVTMTVNSDGSVLLNGTTTDYDAQNIIYDINADNPLILEEGTYIFSVKGLNPDTMYADVLVRDSLNSWRTIIIGSAVTLNPFTITQEIAEKIASREYRIQIKLCVRKKQTVDNLTIYPMIRHAEDLDDTWQPYAPTNRELAERISANTNDLAPIIGEYLPISNGSSSKKRTVAIGGTSATFYAGTFMTKYGAYGSSLNLDISAETDSGDVVAYNNVSVGGSNGTVTITFDELTEQTTFVCKASKIQ